MRDCYIPDLTERYPEGFDGVDMYAPRDLEAEAWAALARDCERAESGNLDGYREYMQECRMALYGELE